MNDSLGDQPTDLHAPGSPGSYDLQASTLLGDYRILRPLGRGGMGQVYLAENRVSGKKIALKLLPARSMLGEGFLDRFRIESRVMSDLHHPNIVQVHHAGEDHGRYYLTMDYIEGPDGDAQTLEDRLKVEGSRLKEEEIKDIALQLLDALSYAHGKGIIHRDLKPANILLESQIANPKSQIVKVADFGLAKVVGDDFVTAMVKKSVSISMGRSIGEGPTQKPRYEGTSTGALLGTYDYMSPEQKAGAVVTEQSDLYAFGVILYRMLTGRKPEGRFKLPSAFGCHPAWDGIVEKCLEPDFQDRYATAAEVKADVERAGTGKKPQNTQKTQKKNAGRGWLAVAAVVVVAAVVGVFFLLSDHDRGRDGARPSGAQETPTGGATSVSPETMEEDPAQDVPITPPQPAGLGGVYITTEPDSAEIELGRFGIQRSGEAFRDVPSGMQTVRVRQEDYQTQSFTIDVPVEAIFRTNVVLQKQRGKMDVDTRPSDAELFIGGRNTGKMTPAILELEVGSYPLRFKKSGYADLETNVVVLANQPARLRDLVMRPERGAIRVELTVEPEAAREHFQSLEKRGRISSNDWCRRQKS